MRRPFTHAGGKPRMTVTMRSVEKCLRCDQTVQLEYQSDAVNAREATLDRYRALRRAGWYPLQTTPGFRPPALCPTHGYEDCYGH
jgi:hypothetical protein